MTYSGKESQKEHLYMNHFAVRLKPVQHCKLTILQLKYNEKFFLSRPGYDYKIMSDWLLLFLNKPENLLRIPSSLERALKLLPENYLLDQSANPTRQSVTLWSHSMKLWLTTEKAMAAHPSTLAWRIPWTEEPGRLQSMGSHRVGHDWSDLAAAVLC